MDMLRENGLDERLAYHFASLFRRSPIPVYEKELMFPCCAHTCEQHKNRPAGEKKCHSPPGEIEEEKPAADGQTPAKIAAITDAMNGPL